MNASKAGIYCQNAKPYIVLLLLCCIFPASFGYSEEPPELYQIRIDDRHGLIDRNGRVIIPAEFDQPLQVSDGLIMASKGTKTAFFDTAGKMVIKPQEKIRVAFSEGLAPAYIHDNKGTGGMGYLDHSLSVVIPGNSGYILGYKSIFRGDG